MAAAPEIIPGALAPPAPAVESARTLFERYSDQIFRFCQQQLGSREEAEDAVQSTFLNAFRSLSAGLVPAAESAWLYKIASNVCLARRRARWRRGRVETPGDLHALAEVIAAPRAVGAERLGRLEDALRSMPRRQRHAILLREWQGLSYREIGDRLELSQSAVETLLFRARHSLATALEAPPERSRVRALLDGSSLVAALKGLFGWSVGANTAAVVLAVTVTSAGIVVGVGGDQGHARVVPPAVATETPASGVSTEDRGTSGVAAVIATNARAADAPAPASSRAEPGARPARISDLLAPAPETGGKAGEVTPAVVTGATASAEGAGSSALTPGHTGAAPGRSGQTPANGALPPGKSGAAPGKSGQTPGKIRKDDPDTVTKSSAAPGQIRKDTGPPGRSEQAPGQVRKEGQDAPPQSPGAPTIVPPDGLPPAATEHGPPPKSDAAPPPGPPSEPPGQAKKDEDKDPKK